MAKRFPIHPPHPERTCWGCDRYCAADAMICGNGTVRTEHPVEFFGPDWHDWVPPSAGGADTAGRAAADDRDALSAPPAPAGTR